MRKEQSLADLTVGEPFRGNLRNLQLRRREAIAGVR
jgi:hypothetical protein